MRRRDAPNNRTTVPVLYLRSIKFKTIEKLKQKLWCPEPDLNRHDLRHYPLKIACLPISPPGHLIHSSLDYRPEHFSSHTLSVVALGLLSFATLVLLHIVYHFQHLGLITVQVPPLVLLQYSILSLLLCSILYLLYSIL